MGVKLVLGATRATARHSDTVLVTRDGFERITQYPDDLASLIVRDKRTIKKIKGYVIGRP